MQIVAESKFTLFRKKSRLYNFVYFIHAKMFVKNVCLLLRLLKFSKTLQFFVFSTIYAIKSSYTNQHIFYFRATHYYRTYYQKKMLVNFGNFICTINCNISNIVVVLQNCCFTWKRFYRRRYSWVYTNGYCQCLYQQCCVRDFKQEASEPPAQLTTRVWRTSFLPSTLNHISNTETNTNTNIEPRPTFQPQNRCFAKYIFRSVVLAKIQTEFSPTIAF